MRGRSKRITGFASIATAILYSHNAYVHVADDVSSLIDVLPNRVPVAHTGRCEQFPVQEPGELGRWTARGRAVQGDMGARFQCLFDES